MYESIVSDYIYWFVLVTYFIGGAIDTASNLKGGFNEEVAKITASHLCACNWLVEQSGMGKAYQSKLKSHLMNVYMGEDSRLWGEERS